MKKRLAAPLVVLLAHVSAVLALASAVLATLHSGSRSKRPDVCFVGIAPVASLTPTPINHEPCVLTLSSKPVPFQKRKTPTLFVSDSIALLLYCPLVVLLMTFR